MSPQPPLSGGPPPEAAAPGILLQPRAQRPLVWQQPGRGVTSSTSPPANAHQPRRSPVLLPSCAPPPTRSAFYGTGLRVGRSGRNTQARDLRARGGGGAARTQPGGGGGAGMRREATARAFAAPGARPRRFPPKAPSPTPRNPNHIQTFSTLRSFCCATSRDSTFQSLNAIFSPILFPCQRFKAEKLFPPPRSRGIGSEEGFCVRIGFEHLSSPKAEGYSQAQTVNTEGRG